MSPVVTISVGTPTIDISNETTTSVSGTGENGDTVTVTASDAAGNMVTSPSTLAITGGVWSINDIDVSSLDDGPISYTAVITDGSGLTAQASAMATKSTVQITSVSPNPINASNDTSTTVNGTCETGTSVTISVTATDNETIITAPSIVVTNGTWSVPGINVSTLNDGTITYTVTATDTNNNVATTSLGVQKSTVSISTVTDPINLSNVMATNIGGMGVPGAGITVTASDVDGGKLTAKTTVLSNGQWNITGFDLHTLSDGTISYLVQAMNLNGTEGNASTTTLKDTEAPVVNSIVPTDPNPTSSSPVAFTVTFSKNVTGVDITAFQLAQAGGVTGAQIVSVTGSGSTYIVTVNTGTGSGTLGLNLIVNGAIVDLDGNPLSVPFTGQTYTIESISPAVTASDLTDAALASESVWT